MLRTQDLFQLLLSIAGVEASPAEELSAGELLLAERHYRTYLQGPFKTVVRRRDGALHLFDLERDPGELTDVAKSHPDVIHRHLQRMNELSRALSAAPTGFDQPSESDRARLRALGYLAE
jgi:hypothetical protein